VLADPRYAEPVFAQPWVTRIVEKILDWLEGLQSEVLGGVAARLFGLLGKWLYWLLIACAAGLVAFLLWATAGALIRRRRQRIAREAPSEPEKGEDALAAVPVERLLALAREARERGEFRLAVRYLFHALLRALHEAGVIRYEPRRANRDYLSSLEDKPPARELFAKALAMFEAKWYGMQETTAEEAAAFERLCRAAWEGELS